MDRIGFVCEPTHPVFWPVAERLAARGFEVRFLDPTDPIPRDAIDACAALAGARLGRTAFDALRYADRVGVETLNGFVPTTALACRLVALGALERVGCPVPEVRTDAPSRPAAYIKRARYRWDTAETFFQRRVDADPVCHRYYAVDDGRETHVRTVTVRSALTGFDDVVADADVDVGLATRVRELLDRVGARALAVDFVADGDDCYAVDVDPTPAFLGAHMDQHVADAVASLTTIGA
ncbi:hypothetical protein ACFQJ5_07640 [Halomicroarcula sp. GCM10025324]|uniref:hypothetical protein n=1 Tax=Haloarcula TaxID=2237 RepID=UPI0023E7C501|nr:hypothetical protein [Halomicroarcula sp. ZS-22-S1]